MRLNVDVPDPLGDTFDALVSEMVEYRLHRYLAQQQARRVGERRTFTHHGEPVDVAFTVEGSDGHPSSVVIEATGGTKGTESARRRGVRGETRSPP